MITPDAVNQAAARVIARGDGWGDRKAFLVDVARELGTTVPALAPRLWVWMRDGSIELARADMPSAMDPAKVLSSELAGPLSTYHFVVVASAPTLSVARPPLPRGRIGVKRNPAAYGAPIAELESPGLELYRSFHRMEPRRLGEFHPRFQIPSRVHRLGDAKYVLYRSGKVDPETLRKPKRPQNYIHDHDAGVVAYDLLGDDDTEVPDFITECVELVRLGDCLGFCWEDDVGEIEAKVRAPLPELYAIPSGRALLVIEDKRKVSAMMWGGALGVEARGIVG